MRHIFVLVTAIAVAGCGRSDSANRRSDTTVTPPVSVDTAHAPAESTAALPTCGITGVPVIESDGIGELKVGRKVEDIRNLCEVKSDSQEMGAEGMKERVLVTMIAGIPVQSLIDNDRVRRISVNTSRIRTRDSLGVDTQLHTLADMRGARFVPGEDGVYAFVADHCGLSFRFSVPMRPPTGRDWTAEAAKREHADAAVNRVLITGCSR
ncbi:MAG TPA: hypothetical protein VF042_16080 [Gemmatimonadaceae bacterium]